MKKNLIILTLMSGMMFLGACKKDKTGSGQPDVITAKDFTYNIALKQVTPDTAISADISSPTGAKLVYCYLVRTDIPDSLVFMGTPAASEQSRYHFSIPTASYAAASHLEALMGIRVMVKHTDNSSYEGLIKVTGFTPPLPELTNIPASLLPDPSGKISVTGTASSENGLKEVAIYDDYQGAFVLVDKITVPGGAKSYVLNYVYTYRKNASSLRIIATDQLGLTATAQVTIPLRSYELYQDITMMANGTKDAPSASSFFLGQTGTVIGSCEISGQETKMDFLAYCTSASVFTFYAPTNTTSIAKNYKCGDAIWEPNTGDLKASRFRVLVPGSAEVDQIYTAYNTNAITDLNDAFFTGIPVPAGNTAKFDPAAVPATGVFNLNTAYLIWVRVPKADGVTFTNELIRVKEVNLASTPAMSTVKFDVMVSK